MVSTANVLSDTILLIRNKLRQNITDPLSRSGSGIQFILTGYPKRKTVYPIITVKKSDFDLGDRLGMQSEKYYATVQLEIRVWARNEKERVELTEDIITYLNSNQFPSTTSETSSNEELHDFILISSVDLDDVEGEGGTLSSINIFQYKFLYGF